MMYSIHKEGKGFRITDGRHPIVSSYPYIPKWYWKWMYPPILVISAYHVRKERRTHDQRTA